MSARPAPAGPASQRPVAPRRGGGWTSDGAATPAPVGLPGDSSATPRRPRRALSVAGDWVRSWSALTRSATTERPATPGPTDEAVASTAERPPATGGGRARWRRYRLPLVVAVTVLLVALLLGLARSRSRHGELDPAATDKDGSRALAVLLDDRGVTVRRETRLDDTLGGTTGRSIVLVTFPDLLPTDALSRLGDLTDGEVVLVGPGEQALSAVTELVRLRGATAVESRAPECEVAAATAAGSVELGGLTYSVDASGQACYPADADATLALARTHGGARLAVLGGGEPLTNGRLAQAGNAALALNLLGADGSADEVRWLVPSPGSAAAGDTVSLSDIVPGWVPAAFLQLLLAALLLALWRARRLGPPVTEPLPVVVRAAEAVEGRARLYRRAQARDRAADALRAGARARLVPRLGLGRGIGGEPDPAAVVDSVSQRTHRSDAEVQAVLYGPPPADDVALVRLADSLDSIVRTTLDPEVRRP